MNQANRPKAANVGLRDRVLEGWFNGQTGELTKGVAIRPSDTVVDVGCGDGGFISFCASQGAEVIFVDRDEQRVRATEAKIRESEARGYRAVVSDCNPVPLDDGTADIVLCTEVLEHVADPALFLEELIRVAKPGGQLLITVPDARSETLVGATAPPQYFQEPNHIRIFSSDQFRDLILAAGLEIESHQYVGCFWSIYWPLSWMTCEPYGEGLPIDNQHSITAHWTALWAELQDHPEGHKIRDTLNTLLPKCQSIVARKKA